MRPADTIRALQAAITARRPILMSGPPGVGKSALLHQAAEALDLDVIDIRAVLLDPVDLRGLPTVHHETDTVRWCPPGFLPLAGQDRQPGVIFLDELPQAVPLVQAALLQGVLDHRLGDAAIHPDWCWVAAGNRQEDRAGANRMLTPLLNRFIHIDVEVSNDDWQDWALRGSVVPEVRSFLKFRPGLLFNFEAARNERAFATPRSWAFVSDLLPHVPEDLILPMISGTVGAGPAAEFCGFRQIWKDLPDVDKTLANPTSSGVPKDPAVLYALSGAIVDKCKSQPASSTDLLNKAVQYSQRMPAEFSVLTMLDLCKICPQVFRIPAASAWLARHRELLGAGNN